MIRIYSISEAVEWDNLVCTFADYDVYYLSGYVRAFEINGDGVPQLLYYEDNGMRAIYVYMKRNTAIDGYFDSISPYGYGGVLFEGDTDLNNRKSFWDAYVQKMKEEHIVCNFVRYHPVLANAVMMKDISEVIDLGKTVAFHLDSIDCIWENMTSKCRGKIRKAEKNGIEILHGHDWSLYKDFMRIYNETMDKDNAIDYYYFKEDFYKSVHEDLSDNYEMFYAVYEGQIIAMSIMLFANKQMHYHLSGSLSQFKNLAPTNLLLCKAAEWGCEHGFKTLHMGGGVGSVEDDLYKFKAGFNRQSDYQFSIAKMIFEPVMYEELVEKRAESDSAFDRNTNFFPAYRS